MAGIKIIDAKVVGLCSKCRKEGDEIPRYTDKTIIEDGFISCITGALGDGICPNREKNYANCTKEVQTHKEFQGAVDRAGLRGYKFDNSTKVICRTPTEEFMKLEKENGVCTKDDGGKE